MAYTYNYNLLLTLFSATTILSTEEIAEIKQSITEVTKMIISVPDSTSDMDVSLGAIDDAGMVLIQSTQTVSVKFNSLEAITGKVFFLKGTSVTAIKVSNDSGSTAVLTVLITD